MAFVQIGQFHSGIEGDFLFVHHVQKFGNKVGQADKTLDLLITFTCSFSNNLCTAFPEIIWDNLSHIFGSSSSSFDCLQLHFVGESPLAWQDGFALKIAVYHEQNSGIIIHIADNDRQGVQSGKLCSVLTAMPGDDLVATFRAWACNQRRKHAVLFYTFHRALHGLIIQNLKGMVFEREQFPNGNLLHLFSLLFLPGFLCGENVICPFQRHV